MQNNELVSKLPRLSILLPLKFSWSAAAEMGPGMAEKALSEKTIQSILDQTDPFGLEIVAAGLPSVVQYLGDIFSQDIRSGRLVLTAVEGTASLWPTNQLLVQALQKARGSWITWTQMGDVWKPGRLMAFEDRFRKHLIWAGVKPGFEEALFQRPRLLWEEAPLVPSSLWIKRDFLEALSGFPTGAQQILDLDYQLLLKALNRLEKDGDEIQFGVYEETLIQKQISPMSRPIDLHEMPETQVDQLRKNITRITKVTGLPVKDWLPMISRLTKTQFTQKKGTKKKK